jgi:hypothetical protein
MWKKTLWNKLDVQQKHDRINVQNCYGVHEKYDNDQNIVQI